MTAKKPTALRLLQGNPGRVPINENEPKPESAIPEAPEYMSELARTEWNRITPILFKLGLLSEVDRTELISYCTCVETIEVSTREIQKNGYTDTTSNGNVIQSPWVGIRNQAMLNAHKFLTEYGMTPASRSKVTVQKKDDPEDELAEFMSR